MFGDRTLSRLAGIPPEMPSTDRDDDALVPTPLRTLREARGISLIDLAHLAGLLPDHLRAIEAGLRPNIPERQAIAAALRVRPEVIG